MTSTLTLALRARNANQVKPRYQICLIHPFDPRGEKVGGLETYIRDFITFHPADTDLLFIGIDSTGDLKLGEIHKLVFRGRSFDFLPILRYSDLQAREAARSIRTSLTGQFFVALLRHFGLIARLIRSRRCSIDLRRVEFSWLPAILRLPFVQMLHGEGAPKLQMDSLLRKYSFVHNAGERFAVATSEKFLCVNPFITERLQKTYPRRKDKIDTLWTWVNTDRRDDAYHCAKGAHALVIVTEWEQFRALDLKEMASIMASSVIVDLRNIYSPEEAMRNGFHYCGVGRPKPLAY